MSSDIGLMKIPETAANRLSNELPYTACSAESSELKNRCTYFLWTFWKNLGIRTSIFFRIASSFFLKEPNTLPKLSETYLISSPPPSSYYAAITHESLSSKIISAIEGVNLLCRYKLSSSFPRIIKSFSLNANVSKYTYCSSCSRWLWLFTVASILRFFLSLSLIFWNYSTFSISNVSLIILCFMIFRISTLREIAYSVITQDCLIIFSNSNTSEWISLNGFFVKFATSNS